MWVFPQICMQEKKLILCKYSVKNKETSIFDGIFIIKKMTIYWFSSVKIENNAILTEEIKEKRLKKLFRPRKIQKNTKIIPSKIQNFTFWRNNHNCLSHITRKLSVKNTILMIFDWETNKKLQTLDYNTKNCNDDMKKGSRQHHPVGASLFSYRHNITYWFNPAPAAQSQFLPFPGPS